MTVPLSGVSTSFRRVAGKPPPWCVLGPAARPEDPAEMVVREVPGGWWVEDRWCPTLGQRDHEVARLRRPARVEREETPLTSSGASE